MEKTRLLIVDDEETITRTLKLYLEGTGEFEVRTENSGSQAMNAAREFKPDLILLDVVMPDADGGEIAAEFGGDPQLQSIPIVFLTALVSEAELHGQGRTIGGHSFLAKPVEPGLLVEHIRACLGG